MNDEILYKQFLDGKQEAFDLIMDKYMEKLIYFINIFVQDIDSAKDISQDVFLYLLINREKFDYKKYKLKTHLFLLAKSRAMNTLKKQNTNIISIEENVIINDYKTDIEDMVFKLEKNEIIKEAINKLKPEYQRAIYLADIEQLEYKEIGQILNKSISSVKVLIHRSRKKLAKILKEESEKYDEQGIIQTRSV